MEEYQKCSHYGGHKWIMSFWQELPTGVRLWFFCLQCQEITKRFVRKSAVLAFRTRIINFASLVSTD
jgi:hypothetical protein